MGATLRISEEFKSLIPPLTQDEYSQLEKNILNDGLREPISVWQNCIVDGHNRFEIAKKHGLDYEIINYAFNDKNEAMLWIIKNQFGRRNLTAYDRSLLALKMKPLIAEKARENQVNSGGAVPQKSAKPIDTRDELAKIASVSHDTIAKVEKIENHAEPEIVTLVKKGNISINQAAQAAALEPEKQKEIAPLLESGNTVEKILSRPHISHNGGGNEWYTPKEHIEAAREVMGGIDYDPASSDIAQKVVQAERYDTIDTNGLTKTWSGRVWMNPPYASELIPLFCVKLKLHVNCGDIEQAIILVNNATETIWFNELIEIASAIVFPKGRVKFFMPDGRPGAPLQGQAVIYIGKSPQSFLDVFRQFGWGALL